MTTVTEDSQRKELRSILRGLFEQGTDVDDALDAKLSNKEFFSTQYSKLVEAAKEQAEKEAKQEREKAESIKKAIMDTEEPF